MSTTRAPQLTDLVTAYLAGDENAVRIIDVSVDVTRTVGAIRSTAHAYDDEDYDEIRK